MNKLTPRHCLTHIFSVLIMISILAVISPITLANCNALILDIDRHLCNEKASFYGITEIEIWQADNTSHHPTNLTSETPKLVIKENTSAESEPLVFELTDLPIGSLVLQEAEDNSNVDDFYTETVIRLRKRDIGNKTTMLVLIPRVEIKSISDFAMDNSTDNSSGGQFTTVNEAAIIIPVGFGALFQLFGWFMTFTDIWDTYFYQNKTERASTFTRALSTLFTLGLNGIPYLVIHLMKLKPKNAPAATEGV